MARKTPGLDPKYQRIRDAREARRREVDELCGFSNAPARAWSKKEARRQAIGKLKSK